MMIHIVHLLMQPEVDLKKNNSNNFLKLITGIKEPIFIACYP